MTIPRQAKVIGAVFLTCEAIALVLVVWAVFHFAPLVTRLSTQVMEVCSA